MTSEEIQAEQDRLNRLFNETEGALQLVRREKRCAERGPDPRERPLLELLDSIEYELGLLDFEARKLDRELADLIALAPKPVGERR